MHDALMLSYSVLSTDSSRCCLHQLARSIRRTGRRRLLRSCGCAAPCQKVCRLVCGEKKVEVICWGCKCEDFCVPCHSERGCKHCETVCDNCGEDGDPRCARSRRTSSGSTGCPGCGKIYTKTKLMKKVETVTVPELQVGRRRHVPPMRGERRGRRAGHDRLRRRRRKPQPRRRTKRLPIFNIVRLPKSCAVS